MCKEVFTGNSCKLVKFTNKYIIYSYDTIIGVIIDNDIYISNKYYSPTTSKYTNILKRSIYNKIYVDNEMDLKIILRRKKTMKKIKVTQKYIKQNFDNIILVHNEQLQFLLYEKEPAFYNAGKDGWYFDVYVINENTCICTGYNPIGNIKTSYNITRPYNLLGKKLKEHYRYYSERYQYTQNKLIQRFVRKILRKEGK